MGISNDADQVIEIPVRELQAFFDDLIQVYNNLNEVLRESGIMRGREAGRAKFPGKQCYQE